MAKHARDLGDGIKRCRFPSREPTPFGKALYKHIGRNKQSVSEFASVIGLSVGFISGIHTGHKPPPISRIEEWATALKLNPFQKEDLYLLAELAVCGSRVRHIVLRNKPHLLKYYQEEISRELGCETDTASS